MGKEKTSDRTRDVLGAAKLFRDGGYSNPDNVVLYRGVQAPTRVGRDGKRLSSAVYDYTFSAYYPCFADLGMPLPAIYPLRLADEFADA